MKSLIVALSLACLPAMTLTSCAVTTGQSSVGQYVDDSTITARVKARFAENEKVSAMRLGVETLGGEVLLSGFALTPEERALAGDLAMTVSGVKSVRNNIEVRATRK
ncbi:transporter [Aquabacterium sp. NJ1]|uniref:BON domain-containing protein n=1 Tax=Aquabacterium sp. NJ1 TaxID=1538295 RepID=UPI00052E363E|nr:BON domain-containing protein [Aquabacterium sp. NJ1]KGM40080.1 transporter [Aquabacterium sp. NJ1]